MIDNGNEGDIVEIIKETIFIIPNLLESYILLEGSLKNSSLGFNTLASLRDDFENNLVEYIGEDDIEEVE